MNLIVFCFSIKEIDKSNEIKIVFLVNKLKVEAQKR